MICAITGHTKGLGKYLYDHFQAAGWDVRGYSRSNGYNLESECDRIVDEIAGVDLFINNAYSENKQTELLRRLTGKVANIVVAGSAARNTPEIVCSNRSTYTEKKIELGYSSYLLNRSLTETNILHLDISFMENTNFPSDNKVSFLEIADSIDFWLDHPNITEIHFRWKMTDCVYSQFEKLNEHNLTPLTNLKNLIDNELK